MPCLSSVACCRTVRLYVGWGRASGSRLGRATRVSQVDGVSDMLSLLCGSVWGRAQKGGNGCCQASGVLSGKKLSPGIYPDARHFSFSLCATGALQAAALMLEPKESESE